MCKVTEVVICIQGRSVMIFFFFFIMFAFHFRCLKGEGEIEKLQTKVLELQRKLDNTTAAVQELGRENQSLQVSHLLM